MAEADDAVAFPIWTLRATHDVGTASWVAVVQSDRHPDGTDVELPPDEAEAAIGGGLVGGLARLDDDGGIERLEVLPHREELPPLWFVEIPEPDRPVPSASLVAYTGGEVATGSLLDPRAARRAKVRTADQVGAVRWYPHSGLVEQLYVTPSWRGRRIGTALLSAVATLNATRHLPRPWGSGQRTAEGDRMRAAGRWKHLSEELSHLLPPMTPADERDDAPPRR